MGGRNLSDRMMIGFHFFVGNRRELTFMWVVVINIFINVTLIGKIKLMGHRYVFYFIDRR